MASRSRSGCMSRWTFGRSRRDVWFLCRCLRVWSTARKENMLFPLPRVYVAEADPSRFGQGGTRGVAELVHFCVCVWLGCARGDVPCRGRNVSATWVRASLDAHHHHQQQLAAMSDVGRRAHEPRTTNIVPSQRTKEESFDPLENCSFSSSVVAREGPLVDWCCCAIFFAFSKEALHTR